MLPQQNNNIAAAEQQYCRSRTTMLPQQNNNVAAEGQQCCRRRLMRTT